MPERAAIVTGGSGGIGLAIAEMLGQEGYSLTIAARRPDKLAAAVAGLRERGIDAQELAVDLRQEEAIREVIASHEERFGRLDVLVNNAGVGFAGPFEETVTKHLDMQLQINLRAMILFYREGLPLLRRAAAEHHNALVVNMSSVSGKVGSAGLGVYSATKHGIVGFTEAMNDEHGEEGVKSCALCPGFVDTELSDYVKHEIPATEMITSHDVAEGVRLLLRLSRYCVVPEIVFTRPGQVI